MIDHVLGRPSLRFRKVQVLAVLAFWITYLLRGDPHGPPIPLFRRVSAFFSRRLTAFQIGTALMLYLYVARNFAKLLNLESPEPLANLYTRSYFRATYVLTCLDAGFWTAMKIRRKWLRDICSIVFSVYYLFAAEQADEKVRRVRATLTVDHLRVSWSKTQTPYLKALSQLTHPVPNRFKPRPLRIPRPKESIYREPVNAWLYFEGTREELRNCTKVVLDFPGGGYCAMDPRCHDDRLLTWAYYCPGTPIISVDYRKAPEHPYPAAVNDCYDVYHSIIYTRGRCIGFLGEILPKIALTGDSAGGNYVAGVTLMIINSTSTSSTGHLMEAGWQGLPLPAGIILIYPSLDLSMSSWITEEQMKLIRQRETMATNRNIVRQKSEQYDRTAGKFPTWHKNGMTKARDSSTPEDSDSAARKSPVENGSTSHAAGTQLAMSSRLSYFNDRVLTPEMMRSMVMLYIGPNHRPDFQSDFFLSPIVAPDALLARFPKTYFLTGERDPLVDDTVIFAGRIRAAKRDVRRHRRELGLGRQEEGDVVEVSLIQGISHGFMMMASLFPAARREMKKTAGWLNKILEDKPGDHHHKGHEEGEEGTQTGYTTGVTSEDEQPLEIGGGLGRGSGKRRGMGQQSRRGMRRGSAVSLGSEDDIVDRRMKGLAVGLAGGGEEE